MISLRAAVLFALAPAAASAVTPGNVDTTFGALGVRPVNFDVGGINADHPSSMRIDDDGRLIVVGTAQGAMAGDRMAIARLTADGALDTTFGPSANGRVTLAGANSSGTRGYVPIIGAYGPCIAGSDTVSTPAPHITLHAQCLGEGGVAESVFAGSPLFMGELLAAADTVSNASFEYTPVAGYIGSGTGRDFHAMALFRSSDPNDPSLSQYGNFGAQGERTVAFDLGGQPREDVATDIVRIPGGGLWVTGWAQYAGADHDFAVVRLDDQGDLVPEYYSGGKGTYRFDQPGSNRDDRAVAAAIDPQGRLVVVGTASHDANGNDLDIAVLRLTPAGALDGTFGTGGMRIHHFDAQFPGRRDEVGGVAIDAQSRVYIVGTHYTGDPANVSDVAVMRLAANGTVDASFGNAGRRRYSFSNPQTSGADRGVDVVLQDAGLVVLSEKQYNPTDTDFAVFRISLAELPDSLFGDSFED